MRSHRLLLPSLAIAALLVGACGGDDDDVGADDTDTTATEAAPAPDEAGDTVTIEGSRFAPETLEVAAGAEVVFENLDSYAHTVTAAEESPVAFDGELAGGDTFSQTFDEPGTYAYFCEIHPTMQAEVVVS